MIALVFDIIAILAVFYMFFNSADWVVLGMGGIAMLLWGILQIEELFNS